MKLIYQVSIPHTSRDYFDYDAGGFEPCIGARVWVPFRNQARLGVVVNISSPEQSAAVSLKSISAVIDEEPLFNKDLLELCVWIGNYYQSPLSEVLPLAIPKKYRLGQPC